MFLGTQQREIAKKGRQEQLRKCKENELAQAKVITPQENKENKEKHNYFDVNLLFQDSVREGDLESARSILVCEGKLGEGDGKIDINAVNSAGLTGIHEAILNGDMKMVQFLCENGADFEKKDVEGWTPLHTASHWGHKKAVRYLLERGANAIALNDDFEFAIDVTEVADIHRLLTDRMNAQGVDEEKARLLKTQEEISLKRDLEQWIEEAGNHVDDFPTINGVTALHIAACKNYVDVVNYLLQNDCDVDPADNEGWTPLHAAIHWDNCEVAQLLFDRGANLEAITNRGESCLDLAEQEDTLQMLEALQKLYKGHSSSFSSLSSSSSVTRIKFIKRMNSQQRHEVTKIDKIKEAESVTERVAAFRTSIDKSPQRRSLSRDKETDSGEERSIDPLLEIPNKQDLRPPPFSSEEKGYRPSSEPDESTWLLSKNGKLRLGFLAGLSLTLLLICIIVTGALKACLPFRNCGLSDTNLQCIQNSDCQSCINQSGCVWLPQYHSNCSSNCLSSLCWPGTHTGVEELCSNTFPDNKGTICIQCDSYLWGQCSGLKERIKETITKTPINCDKSANQNFIFLKNKKN